MNNDNEHDVVKSVSSRWPNILDNNNKTTAQTERDTINQYIIYYTGFAKITLALWLGFTMT